MSKFFLWFPILTIVFCIVGAVGYYFLNRDKSQMPVMQQKNVVEENNEKEDFLPQGSVDQESVKDKEIEIIEEKPFTAIMEPVAPPFVSDLKNAQDVKIDFHYEGDEPEHNYFSRFLDYYTQESTGERFVSLSKLKDRTGAYAYGQEYHSVFSTQGSHWYGGAPVYLLSGDSKYSVAYVGLKINDRKLISGLKAEFGIDFYADLSMGRPQSSFFASILGINPVYACGPGLYLRPVGESELVFMAESDGIAWYRFNEPIELYNLRLNYCDRDCSSKPAYCKNLADDPVECDQYGCCFYDASIKTLAAGNLRMHILYKANDKEGFLKLQIANLILTDSAGASYQPEMGEYFNHYYRAYLH